jgi:dihydrofolate reductase
MTERPVVLQVSAMSLDGYVCEEHTDFERLADTFEDPQRDTWMVESLWRAGHHIMGRVTYESMAAYWPTSSEVFAAPMNQIPKVVFSRTLSSADWPESRIVRGDTAHELAQLKQQDGGEIIAHGGARFSQSLASLDLVDEYRLIVYPITVARGTPLFTGLPQPRAMQLVSQTSFPSGCIALVYQRQPS